jgi:hypothetical protein
MDLPGSHKELRKKQYGLGLFSFVFFVASWFFQIAPHRDAPTKEKGQAGGCRLFAWP